MNIVLKVNKEVQDKMIEYYTPKNVINKYHMFYYKQMIMILLLLCIRLGRLCFRELVLMLML